ASIEHVKRYTTLGMGTDQGKTSNANAIAIISELTGANASDIQHTTFRPPYVPVSLGAIAAEATGPRLAPTRRSAFHDASARDNVRFVTSGDWLYPRYYARGGETMARAIDREVLNTRRRVGMVDMSTLGKADVQGRDALTFLERVYCNDLSRVAVGKLRYSLMLREDGIVLDDGTVSRLGEHHYLLTMTTANSRRVWLHLEMLRQAHWPELDVKLASVTDHWANLAIAGPEARSLLSRLEPDFDIANGGFPFASVRQGRVAGLPARVFRVSFAGELGYEINVPAGYAETLWSHLGELGRDLGLMPYGLEALDVMRIEKGHVSAGTEIDGRTIPSDLGMDRMVSSTKDFIGRALLDRPALSANGRRQFVGLVPDDGVTPIPLGAQITRAPWRGKPQSTIGHVTAALTSPTLGHPVALTLIEDGRSRMGEKVWAVSPVAQSSVEAVITQPAFYDPRGERLHG
ncbi:MAG: glycine cleavage T C-terminal barrel domain-containing protein, partial [Alphaproteobacteria bacterium]